jgi:biotin synthase-related radical SAM superfamily protein
LEDLTFSESDVLMAISEVVADVVGVASWRVDGEAFCTAGCPGCNRPFYNERPAGPMYNYPRPLTPAEVEAACSEMALASLNQVADKA